MRSATEVHAQRLATQAALPKAAAVFTSTPNLRHDHARCNSDRFYVGDRDGHGSQKRPGPGPAGRGTVVMRNRRPKRPDGSGSRPGKANIPSWAKRLERVPKLGTERHVKISSVGAENRDRLHTRGWGKISAKRKAGLLLAHF